MTRVRGCPAGAPRVPGVVPRLEALEAAGARLARHQLPRPQQEVRQPVLLRHQPVRLARLHVPLHADELRVGAARPAGEGGGGSGGGGMLQLEAGYKGWQCEACNCVDYAFFGYSRYGTRPGGAATRGGVGWLGRRSLHRGVVSPPPSSRIRIPLLPSRAFLPSPNSPNARRIEEATGRGAAVCAISRAPRCGAGSLGGRPPGT